MYGLDWRPAGAVSSPAPGIKHTFMGNTLMWLWRRWFMRSSLPWLSACLEQMNDVDLVFVLSLSQSASYMNLSLHNHWTCSNIPRKQVKQTSQWLGDSQWAQIRKHRQDTEPRSAVQSKHRSLHAISMSIQMGPIWEVISGTSNLKGPISGVSSKQSNLKYPVWEI